MARAAGGPSLIAAFCLDRNRDESAKPKREQAAICGWHACTLACSPMDMPPSRYRIVERGRQLVVIDTRPDADVAEMRIESVPPGDALNPAISRTVEPSNAPVSDDRAGMGLLAQAGGSMGDGLIRRDASGDAEYFDTRRWFDDNGPRRIKLSKAGRERLNGAILIVLSGIAMGVIAALLTNPLILLGLFALMSEKPRASIRARVTRWIDGLGTTEPR